MKKYLYPIALFALMVAILIVNLTDRNEEKAVSIGEEEIETAVEIGKRAPDFTLNTLDGEQLTLSQFRGNTVILNFWATWCPPCKAEMPHMENFYKKEKDNGIEIVAVNLTTSDKGIKEIERFVKEYGLTFPIPLDEEGKVGSEYGAVSIPTSYIIDSNGIIQEKVVGPMSEEMLKNLTEGID